MCLKIVHSLVALEKHGLRYPDLCSDNILIRPSGIIKLGMHILTRSDIGLNRVTAFPEKWTPSSKVDHAGRSSLHRLSYSYRIQNVGPWKHAISSSVLKCNQWPNCKKYDNRSFALSYTDVVASIDFFQSHPVQRS